MQSKSASGEICISGYVSTFFQTAPLRLNYSAVAERWFVWVAKGRHFGNPPGLDTGKKWSRITTASK